MNLYFAPLACSMASRIAFYEAGAQVRFTYADTRTKTVDTPGDFLAVNPMGQVPVLALDDGRLVTENAAVLQAIADIYPAAALAPPAGSYERTQLQSWLNFIATELHKATFVPLLDAAANQGAKDYARAKGQLRLKVLNDHLTGREWLLDAYSIADAYLFTVLNWGQATATDLAAWPAIKAFYDRAAQRPAVARALAEEFALYREEQARRKAA
jgi:glutathione S-transferase